MNTPFPKYCRDCKWSKPKKDSDWNLRCHHPIVNGHDQYALGASQEWRGVDCSSVRGKSWPAKCGMRGALWEAK